MICSRCAIDQDASEFGPSAAMWPQHRVCHKCGRQVSQRKRHGLTRDDRNTIAAHQGGCAICGHPEPGGQGWVVDHDHACCDGDASCPKCRRGVICQWCNWMLGYAFDRVETLKAAVIYLECPKQCVWHMPIACAPGICGSEMHVRTETTDELTGLVQVDRSSLDLIARREIQSDFSMGSDTKQSTDSAL